jgi:CysZ protein
MREFGRGIGTLVRGFGMWRRIPGAMALGLVPAIIVVALVIAALVALAFALPDIVTAITPFADGWPEFWAGALRIAVSLATLGGAFFVAAVTTTALTLALGEPFYDRIWRAVERSTTGAVPEAAYGFWRAVGDSAGLLLRGLGVALLAWLTGLVPFVGGFAGALLGVTLTGWLLADELTSRALTARGMDRRARRRLLRRFRPRALGFGVATQVCFLIPFGAIAVMPAAVAGSTLLAQEMLALSDPSRPAPPPAVHG